VVGIWQVGDRISGFEHDQQPTAEEERLVVLDYLKTVFCKQELEVLYYESRQ